MKTITVKSGQSYDVIIGSDPSDLDQQLIKKIASAKIVAIFFQPSVAKIAHNLSEKLTLSGYCVHTMQLPDAERGKDITSVIAAWDFLGNIALGRTDVVISLGGGAVTDVTGFIASTWLRGVAVIHIPTTLLAMVDAAVGGKTGINTSAGKNLVGTFYEPSAVLIDTTVLTTMPKPDIAAGMAEIIKCGFIADPTILDLIEEDPADAIRTVPKPSRRLIELIERSIQVKADVVTSDFKESHYREILNYGHTLAHAIERREKYQWRHGDAVAVGMVYAAELARISGRLDALTADRHRRIIELVGLPVTYDPDAFPDLLATMSLDKKTRSGILRFVILDALAHPTRLEGPDRDLLTQAYAALHANG